MNHDITTYKNQLEQKKGMKKSIQKSISQTESKIKSNQRELRNVESAQAIVQTVGQKTQEQLEYHISDIVSLALSAIFDDPYEFKLDFVIKRGKTEGELWFVRNKEKIHPLTASGGGAVDVASFGLRIALWSLQLPRSRNVIVLDEPFRFLSSELQPKAGEMLKMVSEKLKLQFLIVTHNQDLIEAADKVFQTTIKKGITEVKEV